MDFNKSIVLDTFHTQGFIFMHFYIIYNKKLKMGSKQTSTKNHILVVDSKNLYIPKKSMNNIEEKH